MSYGERARASARPARLVTVAGASIVLLAENPNRSKWFVRAPLTVDIEVNVTGSPAGPGLVGSVPLYAGEMATSDHVCETNAISIWCATGGIPVAGYEA